MPELAALAALRPLVDKHEVFDIADPIGEGPDVFATVGHRIAELLPPILELCRVG